tara:strand:+ start:143 stop:451 length:309 start_codon:yes stop_codon:yes gene_type:complete
MGKYIFDQFVYLHFAAGIVAYFFGIKLPIWILLHTMFELAENTNIGMTIINKYMTFWPGGKPYADTDINMIGDTIGTLIGWLSAYYLDTIGAKMNWYEKHDV